MKFTRNSFAKCPRSSSYSLANNTQMLLIFGTKKCKSPKTSNINKMIFKRNATQSLSMPSFDSKRKKKLLFPSANGLISESLFFWSLACVFFFFSSGCSFIFLLFSIKVTHRIKSLIFSTTHNTNAIFLFSLALSQCMLYDTLFLSCLFIQCNKFLSRFYRFS